MSIALIYGTDTQNTERVAEQIQAYYGADTVNLFNLAEHDFEEILASYEYFIFGAPTWYDGELQADWEEAVPLLEETDLNGKHFAVFGLGDQLGYGDWFVDAIGIIADAAEGSGAQRVGDFPNENYDFVSSKGLRDGVFLGLPIDEDNQPDLTEERLFSWLEDIAEAFGIETALSV